MLDKLKKQGKTLIVATSKPTCLAERVLSHFKLDHYFTFVSGAEMNGDRSEKIEIILHAFEKNKINDLERCVMVGDRKHDIIGAKKAGIDSIGVLYGYGGHEELSDAGATHLTGSVAELEILLCE
ncbi:MAG: HAD-IA family hydrolase [Phycisphaerales bacterium]|nr:HAD-IA family hydrolase [Phycisphaerales bacterium]